MKNLFRSGLLILFFTSSLAVTAQQPMLSSNPSANAVLFYDFDGHTVTGTSWNFNGPIVCGASGLDDAQIIEVFNRIAEDYRPFNINVTTDSTKYLAAPANRRMRVIVTVSSSWYGSAGGVAFVNSFTWSDDTPCFVFSALLEYNVKYISEAASHEAGHTLGLYHQSSYDENCIKLSDYNYGLGAGEIGWAPIMGAGYYRNFTLWNNGPSSYGCTNYQSDLSIITSGNGFSYRTDDHSAAFNQATNAPFVNNQFTVSGIVERNTDQDMIRFTQPSMGRFQLTAVPYNVGTGNSGSDLDLQVTLFNSAQVQLNVFNPGTLLNSVVDTTLAPGVYYLKIEGKGNQYAPNYASLGSYSLQGNWSSSTLPLRTLRLHGQLNGDRHQLSWMIDADEQVIEQILEVSTDGRSFSPVVQSAVNTRAYDYRPSISGTALYRLNVTFDNGRQYYSNIVTLRNTGKNTGPKVVSNLLTGNSFEVTSPGVYDYAVFDFNGKTLAQGKLVSGSNIITPSNITSGMYVVRFTNGTTEWMEKLVRQ